MTYAEIKKNRTHGEWKLNAAQSHIYAGPGYSETDNGPYLLIADCDPDVRDLIPTSQCEANAAAIQLWSREFDTMVALLEGVADSVHGFFGVEARLILARIKKGTDDAETKKTQ